MGNYGTNLTGFGAFEGGINADKGSTLISTNSEGEDALLFGPAALREIQAGVANGDFSIPPDAAGDTITEENPLPYWTFTDIDSDGAISCAVLADASAGSGNVLKWSIDPSTGAGVSATLSRFIPVAATKNRAFVYSPEVNTNAATNTSSITMRMQGQYYQDDQVTPTGTAIDSTAKTFATLGSGPNWLTGPFSTRDSAPANAAYIKITITVETVATTPGSVASIQLTEVRLIRGDQTNLIAEYVQPSVYPPTLLRQINGVFTIAPSANNGDTQVLGGFIVDGLFTADGGVAATGDLYVDGDITATGDISSATFTTGELNLTGDLYVDGNIEATGNITGTIISGTDLQATTSISVPTGEISAADITFTGTMYGQLIETTGITSTGSINTTDDMYTRNFTATGDITYDGSLTNYTVPTTTSTTDAATWVSLGGTIYELCRYTSSNRYKINIVDADQAVLDAARKIKPRHFESTIPHENGATRLGFIAEEVLEAGLSHAVGYNAEGQVSTIDTVALLAALYARVNDLEERIKALEAR